MAHYSNKTVLGISGHTVAPHCYAQILIDLTPNALSGTLLYRRAYCCLHPALPHMHKQLFHFFNEHTVKCLFEHHACIEHILESKITHHKHKLCLFSSE